MSRQSRGAAERGRTRLIIAVDGPAGAGKSTAARGVAAALGYTYVDTGAMYRAVGLAARRRGVDPGDAEAVAALVDGLSLVPDSGGTRILLDGADVTVELRAPDAATWASRVAALPAVRARLLDRQRALAAEGGVVMDGRDIGTVVFPDADCKFFLIASTDERARRRHAEDADGGMPTDLAATRADIEARDRRDRERAVAPLRAAGDAVVIDTSSLTPEGVMARMLEVVRARARP
jgi:cytidylate kinase